MKEEEPQEVVALVNRIIELEATIELLTQRCIELEQHLSGSTIPTQKHHNQ
jgi:hypothetical protein